MSAISWNSGGVEHSEVFSIGVDNEVWADKDGAGLVNLSGYLTQISAGLDDNGNPELYGIGGNNAVWVNHLNGGGWSSLGGNVNAISASNLNTVFAISGNSVYDNFGSGWNSLGEPAPVVAGGQISAGLTSYNTPEVYLLGSNDFVYAERLDSTGWSPLGGGYTSISATSDNTVFALGTNNAVYVDYGSGFWYEGGYLLQITAGLDTNGFPEVYGIGSNNAAFVNNDGGGWVGMGGYVSDLAASTNNTLFVRGEIVSQIFSDTGSGYNYLGDMPIVEPGSGTSYAPADDSIKLYSNGSTGSPSYLDVAQGATDDCWLLASLAEVAARDPQDITSMFTSEPFTVAPNGALVWNYQVRFFKPDGSAFSVEVDSQIPAGAVGDSVTNDLGTSSLWVALAEKAYVEANALGFVGSTDPDNGTYASLDNGHASDALHAITGKASNWDGNPADAAAAWNAGDLVVLSTTDSKTSPPPSSYIVGDHVYAMVGLNASSSQPFLVFNPWGMDSSGWAPGHSGTVYGRFTATQAFITQNFIGIYTGSGSGNVADTTGTVDGPTALTTSGGAGGGGGAGKVRISDATSGVSVVDTELLTSQDSSNARPATAIDAEPSEALHLESPDLATINQTHTQKPMIVVGAVHPGFLSTKFTVE